MLLCLLCVPVTRLSLKCWTWWKTIYWERILSSKQEREWCTKPTTYVYWVRLVMPTFLCSLVLIPKVCPTTSSLPLNVGEISGRFFMINGDRMWNPVSKQCTFSGCWMALFVLFCTWGSWDWSTAVLTQKIFSLETLLCVSWVDCTPCGVLPYKP